MRLLTLLFFSFPLLILVTCSSTKPADDKAWIRNPARTVDSGYIVYVGTGEDISPEKAQFKAEAIAIGDLANECSFAPKGARIEDHYDEKTDRGHTAYAKVGITYEECEQAKQAVKPEDIQKLGNVAMTEELKRFQDAYYTSNEGNADQAPAQASSSNTSSPAPYYYSGPVYIHDDTNYFVVRSYVAYEKQVVILSPPGVYVPASPAYVNYVHRVSPMAQNVQAYEVSNPGLRSAPTTWSTVQQNPNSHLPGNVPHLSSQRLNAYRGGGYAPQNALQRRSNPATMRRPQPARPAPRRYRRRPEHR